MDDARFDTLARCLATPSRRAFLTLAGGAALTALLAGEVERTAAKKKRKKKRRKSKKKSTLPPASPAACVPNCPPNACGTVPDGCGGTLSCGGCAGNSVCHAGVCQSCDVTCLNRGQARTNAMAPAKGRNWTGISHGIAAS
jgi:hypothetical protein